MTDREIPEEDETFSKEAVLRRGGILPVVIGDQLSEAEWLEKIEIENNERGITEDPVGNEVKPAYGTGGRFVLADPSTPFEEIARRLGLPVPEEDE